MCSSIGLIIKPLPGWRWFGPTCRGKQPEKTVFCTFQSFWTQRAFPTFVAVYLSQEVTGFDFSLLDFGKQNSLWIHVAVHLSFCLFLLLIILKCVYMCVIKRGAGISVCGNTKNWAWPKPWAMWTWAGAWIGRLVDQWSLPPWTGLWIRFHSMKWNQRKTQLDFNVHIRWLTRFLILKCIFSI